MKVSFDELLSHSHIRTLHANITGSGSLYSSEYKSFVVDKPWAESYTFKNRWVGGWGGGSALHVSFPFLRFSRPPKRERPVYTEAQTIHDIRNGSNFKRAMRYSEKV